MKSSKIEAVAHKKTGSGLNLESIANNTLKTSAVFWFIITVIGQWVFAYYVAAFYGGSAMAGNVELWNDVMPHGYVLGDSLGNAAVAAHLFLAVLVLVGGPLQIIPQIRTLFPAFHRWNGRIYIITVFLISLAGIYMVWTRGTVSGYMGDISITLNGVLIIAFAIIAVRYAVARDLKTHRRWALRLFLVVSGVWFFRVGLMLWLFIFQEPVGFDMETFRGPFLTFLGFAQYLLPLAVFEMYLRTEENGSSTGRILMSTILLLLTVGTGIGIFATTLGMWLPHL